MSLYLVRHAHALSAEEDPARPLSQRGRKQVAALAAFLRGTEAFQTAEVWHSPLARSVETAQLLVAALELDARQLEVAGLEGDDDPAIVAEQLRNRTRPLAVIGHEPHLSALASLLVAGETEPARFILKKAAVLALEKTDGAWAVRWQVSPEILP